MRQRRLRAALELVSDIGSLGFDLQHHSEVDIMEAVKLLRTVNPELFTWLVRMLGEPTSVCAVDPHVDSTGKLPTRV